MPGSQLAMCSCPPVDDVPRTKRGGGAVTHADVRGMLDLSRSQEQRRLCALEQLPFAYHVHGQHRLVMGRLRPDDLTHLIDEGRMAREPEVSRTTRLQTVRRHEAMRRCRCQTSCSRERAARRVCAFRRLVPKSALDQRGDLRVTSAAHVLSLTLIVQPGEAEFEKAHGVERHGRAAQLKPIAAALPVCPAPCAKSPTRTWKTPRADTASKQFPRPTHAALPTDRVLSLACPRPVAQPRKHVSGSRRASRFIWSTALCKSKFRRRAAQ